MHLDEALEQVCDQHTFLEFVHCLIEDRLGEVDGSLDLCGRGANGWENHRIEDFLDAAVRWAEDSDFGANQEAPDTPIWKKVAVFLYCGKIYE